MPGYYNSLLILFSKPVSTLISDSIFLLNFTEISGQLSKLRLYKIMQTNILILNIQKLYIYKFLTEFKTSSEVINVCQQSNNMIPVLSWQSNNMLPVLSYLV